MKILHLCECFLPNTGYHEAILAKFQVKMGHEVIILSTALNIVKNGCKPYVSDDPNIDDLNYSQKYGVKIIRVPSYGVISDRIIWSMSVFNKIKIIDPDVIHVHGTDTLIGIFYILKYNKLNYPVVYDCHMCEIASHNKFNKIYRWLYKRFITPLFVKNKIIAIRTADDDYLMKHLGFPKELCPLISFGSDTSIFYPDQDNSIKFRREFNISASDFVIVYSGKLDFYKGGQFLAKAFADKFKSSRNVVLLVIGNIPSDDYGEKVNELFSKSQNRIIQFPIQRYVDLPKFFQAANLAVFPKECSLTFYDAQACGLPVIAEDNNINIDRLSHNNGFIFKSGDIKSFREKINCCVEMNLNEYAKLCINAKNYVYENFNYENISKQYTNILEEVFKRHN